MNEGNSTAITICGIIGTMLLTGLVFLLWHETQPSPKLIYFTEYSYRLTNVDPPKHVHADVVREDGEKMRLSFGKHYSNWELLKGLEFKATEGVYEHEDGTQVREIFNLRETIDLAVQLRKKKSAIIPQSGD